MQTIPRRPRVCGLVDAAALLRIDEATLRSWVRGGLLPSQQIGGHYLLDPVVVLLPFSRLPPLPERASCDQG